ncbi:MAG: DNA-directed RNA polymerase subunit alpha [Patescibacteria group bacterium]
MESIALPSKIEIKSGKEPNSAELIVEPCYQGYGTTLGNALRRVLLSSIPGAAATAVKIKGVDHEFSGIPNAKEDAVQLILNLKQLRLRIHTDEPVRLHLSVKGERIVTAKDIEASSAVDIINPDLYLAELTSKDAELELEIFAECGRGYLKIEERAKRGLELGTMAIDAIYTPIRNVSFHVEPVRVGQITNFDKLIVTIETDGSITPEDAIKQAAKILIDHFSLVSNLEMRGVTTPAPKEETPAETPVVDALTAAPDTEAPTEEKKAKKRSKKSEE